MASADIDGFRIRIDDTLARDISKVDKALQNIEVHGAAAGQALMNFKAGLAGMRGFEGDAGAVANYLEKIKTAMENMPVNNLAKVASSLSSITQEINNLNTDKLSTAFRAAETPATGIVNKVADLVNSLAQIPEKIEKTGTSSSTVFENMHKSLSTLIDDIAVLQQNVKAFDAKNVKLPKSHNAQTVLPNDEYFISANKMQETVAMYEKAQQKLSRLEEEYKKVKAAEESAAAGSIKGKITKLLLQLTEDGEKRTSDVIQREINNVKRIINSLEEEKRALRENMNEQIRKGKVSESVSQTERKATERNIAGLREEIKERKRSLQEGEGITRAEGKQQSAVDELAQAKAELKKQETSLTEQLKKQYEELLKLDKIYEKLSAREYLNLKTGGKSGDLTYQEIQLQEKINEEIQKREALIQANTALSTKEGQALKANYELELLRIKAENDRRIAEQQKRYESKPSTTTKKKDTTSNKTEKSPEEIRIEKLVKEYKSVLSQMQTIEKAQAQANKTLSDKNATQDEKDRAQKILNDTTHVYEQLAQRRVEIEQETNKKIVALRNKASATIAKAEAQRLKQEQKDREQKAQIDPNAAIQYAKNAKSINDLNIALKNLKKVMGETEPNKGKWNELNKTYQDTKKRLDDIRRAMDGVKNESKNTLPSLQNLAMQFGVMFSVQQLIDWTKHMVEVRAQFELQNIALRSIIQDKQKADEVFAQVQQLALKSPFSIMQLNTYTKQIAAYGVEAEKLVGTTKMLADVSAGLGVDMGRLILAYGQVKTANYLRATEVRQFTEAGLNITQELANYFTELNGKMVTAGEVTEMITKRMVKFEDVAEVFHRVTSAGGMFYNMQEKQAEGLHGQIQRIGDAYSMMLNDMGKNNEGVISKTLATIRVLIQNWRSLAPWVEATVVAFAGFYTAKGIVGLLPLLKNIGAGFSLIAAEMRAATGAMATLRAGMVATNTLIGTMGWIGLATAIGAAVFAMSQASTSTSQLQEDLERMKNEILVDVADSVGRFKELADVIKDPTAAFEDQKKALDELRRAYGDILPSEMLEIDNIRKMGSGYMQAAEAIREYYRTKLKEEQTSRVEADAVSMFATASKDVVEDAVKKLKEYGASKSTVQKIMNGIIEQAKSGAIKGAGEIAKAFQTALEKYYNIKFTKFLDTSDFDLLAGAVTAYQNELASLDTTVIEYETHEEELEHKTMQDTVKKFEEQKKKVEALISALKELYGLRVTQDRTVELGGVLGATDNISKAEAIVAVKNAYADLGDTTVRTSEQIMGLVQSTYNLDAEISRVTHSIYGSFIKGLSDTKTKAGALANNKYLQTWIQGLQREIDAVDGTPVQKQIRLIEKSLSDLYHLDLGSFDWLKTDAKSSIDSVAKEIKGKIDEITENIKRFKIIASTSILLDPMASAKQQTGIGSQEELKAQEDYLKVLTQFYAELGRQEDKKKTKGTDKTEQLLRNRINLLKEANQMYEKLNKEYGKDISYQQTYNNLLARAKELGIKNIFDKDTFTNKSTLAAMEALYNKAGKGFNYFTKAFRKKYGNAVNELLKEIGEQKYQLAVDINKESREKINRQLDEMFGKYDLYIELNKEGVDSDIIKSLFDVDKTSITEIYDEFNKMVLNSANEAMRQKKADFKGFSSIEQAKAELGTEYNKMYADNEKKLTDRLEKEYETRMKSYLKYMKKSYSDAAQAQISEYSQLSELAQIMSLQKAAVYKRTDFVSEDERNAILKRINEEFVTITNAVREKSKEALDNALFQQFKEDPIFEELFGDLSLVSTKIIDVLYDKIEDLKGSLENLDPKKVKELVRLQQQLFAVKAERNPFKAYFESLEKVRDLRKELKDEGISDPTLTLVNKETELNAINSTIDGLDVLIDLQKKRIELNKQVAALSEKDKAYLSTDENVLLASLSEKEMAANKLEERKETEKLNSEELDRLSTLKKEIRLIQKILSLKSKMSSQTKQENKELQNSPYKDIYQTLNEAQLLAEKTGQTKKAEEIKDLISKLKEYTDAEEEAASAGKKLGSTINAATDVANKGIDAWVAGMKMCGHSLTEGEQLWVSFAQQALTAIASITAGIIAGEIALNSASGIIGVIATSLTLIAGLFTTIFGAHEADLQEQIEEVQRQVDKLQHSFENLKDSIDNAFTGAQLSAGTDEAIRNLEEQNKQYQRMIDLESDKKDKDEGKIIGYQNSIDDNIRKMKELQEGYVSALGGFGSGADVAEASKNFVDAWTDAFGETAEGLSGLQEDFDDYIKNIMKKQAYLKAAEFWIKPLTDKINNAFNKYGGVDFNQLKATYEEFKSNGMIQMDAFMEDFTKMFEDLFGMSWGDSASQLSGLAAGIQGVTEETAQVVEAMLNSMRFYVADTNKELKNIVMTLTNPPSDNVFLSELKAQTAQLEMLNKTLNGLVRAGHRMGGHGLKVFTN